MNSTQYIARRATYPGYSNFRIINLLLIACGIVAIASCFAPDLLEGYLPNWKARFGILVAIGVLLGVLRASARCFYHILSLGFWVVAACCLLNFHSPLIGKRANSSVQESLPALPSAFNKKRSLGPALPDASYFPAQRTNNGVASLLKHIKLGKG